MVTFKKTWKGDVGIVGGVVLWSLGVITALLGALMAISGAVMMGVCVVFMHKGARYTITAILLLLTFLYCVL